MEFGGHDQIQLFQEDSHIPFPLAHVRLEGLVRHIVSTYDWHLVVATEFGQLDPFLALEKDVLGLKRTLTETNAIHDSFIFFTMPLY